MWQESASGSQAPDVYGLAIPSRPSRTILGRLETTSSGPPRKAMPLTPMRPRICASRATSAWNIMSFVAGARKQAGPRMIAGDVAITAAPLGRLRHSDNGLCVETKLVAKV